MIPCRRLALAAAVAAVVAAASPGCLVSRFEQLGVTDASARAGLSTSTIVFSRSDGLYLARGDGSAQARLLSSGEVGRAGAVFMPEIDTGGRRVLFLSVQDLDVRESTGRDLSLNILVLDRPAAPGVGISSWHKTRLEKIAPPGEGGRQEIFAVAGTAWSHDGGRIALGLNRSESAGGDAVVLFDADGDPVAEYDLNGRDLARVSALSWTNDGESIVLGLEGERDAPGVVVRLDLPNEDAGRGAPALVEIAPGSYPALSPDGTRIAAIDNHSGHWDIVLLGMDGKEVGRYERPAGRAPNRPFWSADGRYIYYYSLAATGPLGLIDVSILRCLDTRTRQVFDLVRLG